MSHEVLVYKIDNLIKNSLLSSLTLNLNTRFLLLDPLQGLVNITKGLLLASSSSINMPVI